MTNLRLLSLLLFTCIAFSLQAQKKPVPRQYKFTPPKSAQDARKSEEMSAKNVNVKRVADDVAEEQAEQEETGGSQNKVVRRVGVVSNIPKNSNVKMGGTKNPDYNPHLRDALNKQEAKKPTTNSNINAGQSTTPTKMKIAPSKN